MKWIEFPADAFEVCGLPWFAGNAPELWRLPARVEGRVRDPVWQLGRFPSGGRIRFAADTTKLAIRMVCAPFVARHNMSPYGRSGLDVYVDGSYWNSVCPSAPGEQTGTFFDQADRQMRQFTIYLPLYQELRVLSIGVDEGAQVQLPAAHQRPAPIVLYGSSVLQGAGACRPAMTYEAILGRSLGLDYVDLGFGGNGRAEAEVVELLAEVDACAYVFDLGKSFDMQPASVYVRMLERLRAAHPNVPQVCLTPIYSTRESLDAEYLALSLHTRQVVVEAVQALHAAGDTGVFLMHGFDLLGPHDADAFHEGVHPTDYGFWLIAQRLQPLLAQVLAGRRG